LKHQRPAKLKAQRAATGFAARYAAELLRYSDLSVTRQKFNREIYEIHERNKNDCRKFFARFAYFAV
jgi:hypothetical protein